MNRLKYSLIAIFAFGSLAVFGQKSTGAAQFPALTPDVRGVGMGNSGVAATANAFSIYRNAAKSIFSTPKAEIGYSFTPWLRELSKGSNLHGVAGYCNLNEKQGITAGFRWFNHPETNVWDKDGNDAGTFTPKDWSVDVGYARKLTDDLSVGATARFIRSDMSGLDKDDAANAVAFDLGLYYRRNFENWEQSQWAVGLQASNFGTKIDYGYGKYDQASKIAVGGMIDHVFTDKHRLQGTLDVACQVLPNTNWGGSVGVEYTLLQIVAIRGGYHYGEQDNKLQRYGTLGCGVGCHHIKADFAYLIPEKDSLLKNTWQVALSIDLGLFKR